MRRLLLLLPFLAVTLHGETTPSSVAMLVKSDDDAALSEALTSAMRAPDSLVRATAARVVAVRGLTRLVPLMRETLDGEKDSTAAREEIRALALLGSDDDIKAAVSAASRWPASMDNALALTIARRGGADTIRIYTSTLRATRMTNAAEFFRTALWGHPAAIAFTGSRLLGDNDHLGWRGLLQALEDSNVAMNAGVLSASLRSDSELIRTGSVWYLVRGYALEPSTMGDVVKNTLAETRLEVTSDREAFGRELLHRMLGAEKVDNPRWLAFLGGSEADPLFAGQSEALQYLTDAEYLVRYNRCGVQPTECAMPRTRATRTIPSQPVSPPAFSLPETLPSGLASAIMTGTRCNDSWIGVATATVDPAGRVRTLDLAPVGTSNSCRRAIEMLLRLSMATNTSMRSEFSGPVLLVHAAREPLCLDEDRPESGSTLPLRIDGEVQAPKVLKRFEPQFPESARKSMGISRNVLIIIEAVISKTGCVRSMRVVKQSPYPELNGAALMALSKWKFSPGSLSGQPVDVLFNLTINFATR